MNKTFISRALLAASVVLGLSGAMSLPASAEEWRDHDGGDWHDRGRHEGRGRDWDDHDWRDRHYYAPPPMVYEPQPRAIYVPPPVYAAPVYPMPGLNLVFPLHIR